MLVLDWKKVIMNRHEDNIIREIFMKDFLPLCYILVAASLF